jgi:hypothetical protein
LLEELTIVPCDAPANPLGQPLLIHSLERSGNRWQITAGGRYQKVQSGIYDLFGATTMIISAIAAEDEKIFTCQYCQTLLFGLDAEPCAHLFMRITPAGLWAPGLDNIIKELNIRLRAELSAAIDFKKFLIANQQLGWQRITHREASPHGIFEVMVFISENPPAIFDEFIKWAQLNSALNENRKTGKLTRVTGRHWATSRHQKITEEKGSGVGDQGSGQNEE